MFAEMAQLVEQLIRNQQVVGSSPILSSKGRKNFSFDLYIIIILSKVVKKAIKKQSAVKQTVFNFRKIISSAEGCSEHPLPFLREGTYEVY